MAQFLRDEWFRYLRVPKPVPSAAQSQAYGTHRDAADSYRCRVHQHAV
jgi:hypothetical protein